MLTHRGFSAWIVVDGKPLPEYLIAINGRKNIVSCWIPSEEGKNFAVHWKDHGGKVDTCSFITLDGFVVPGRFLFGEGTTFREGVRTSPSTERPFVFQKVDETSEALSESSTKDVGMITLRIKRVSRVEARPANPMQELPTTLLGKRKAGDFRISFGNEKVTPERHGETWSVVAHDKGSKKPETYVSFVFRYRSREFLETQGIATDPEPEPAPTPPKRAPVRRIVSAPLSAPPLAPPRKKAKLAVIPGHLGPGHFPRVYDTRRAVSCRGEPQKLYPLPGPLTPDSPWADSADSSPVVGYGQLSSGTDGTD
ncbi:hypothetical protein H0H81_006674 [Sphagnurus paluster]|uniref:DUF7918 domain-containing protein n=1 Tax=Sphagnurus paluster TaxID=117069 RepID=A0A9P7GJW7_9AGAR|nr:hypothetical protein H0H81_006674 [Sphagnurus paluster]